MNGSLQLRVHRALNSAIAFALQSPYVGWNWWGDGLFVILVAIWLAAIWFVFVTDLQFKWERRPQLLSEETISPKALSHLPRSG